MNSFKHQWLSVPQVSFQGALDVPLTYQIGLSLKFLQQCVFPGSSATELLYLQEHYITQNILVANCMPPKTNNEMKCMFYGNACDAGCVWKRPSPKYGAHPTKPSVYDASSEMRSCMNYNDC